MTLKSKTILHPVILPVPETDRGFVGRQKVRNLSRIARIALQQSCEKSGLALRSLPKNELGAPLPVDGVYWSLTHKSDVVGAVAAQQPVGLDLETVRPVNESLLSKVADEEEWKMMGGERVKSFFRLWTGKEAVLKAVGKGITGLSRCRVARVMDDTHSVFTYDGFRWAVVHFWFDGHVAALTPKHCQVTWTCTSMDRLL